MTLARPSPSQLAIQHEAECEQLVIEIEKLIKKLHNPLINYLGSVLFLQLVQDILFNTFPRAYNPLLMLVRKIGKLFKTENHICDYPERYSAEKIIEFASLTFADIKKLSDSEAHRVIHQKMRVKCLRYSNSISALANLQIVATLFSTLQLSKLLMGAMLRRKPLGLLGINSSYASIEPFLKMSYPRKIPNLSNKKTLIELRNSISQKHFYFRQVARAIVMFSLVLSLINNEQPFGFGPALFLIPTALASLNADFLKLLNTIIQHASDRYAHHQQIKYITDFQAKLTNFSTALHQAHWGYKTTDSGIMFYLYIQEAFNSSKKSIYHCLKFVFTKHQIPLLYFDQNHFIIDGNTEISDLVFQKMIKDAQIFLNRHNQRLKIESQLTHLIDKGLIYRFEVEATEDKNNNLEYQFLLLLDFKLTEAQQLKIARLLNVNFSSDNKSVLICSANSFDSEILLQIEKIHDASVESTTSLPLSLQPNTSAVKKRRLSTQSEVKKQSVPVELKPTIIQFGAYGTFNSANPKCEIKEIISPFYPRYTHFGIFNATTGDKKRDEIFKSHFEKSQQKAPKGNSGIVRSSIRMRNHNGNWMLFKTAKIKDPTQDGRVVASKVIKVGSNITLYDFDTFVPKHK